MVESVCMQWEEQINVIYRFVKEVEVLDKNHDAETGRT
jgi:hypothetical protein